MKKPSLVLLLVFLMLGLSGCSADLVTSSDDLGGVQSGPKWGIVKYLNGGADFVINIRKNSARDIMTKTCNPMKYKVIDFNSNTTTSFAVYNGSGGGGSSEYIYIKFECVE